MRRLREMLPLGGAQMSEMARLVGEQNAKVWRVFGVYSRTSVVQTPDWLKIREFYDKY